MVKSINKRIILGFVIVLTLLLCPNVHAKSINVNPDKICAIEGVDTPCNYSTPLTYQVAERHMYGNTFGAQKTRSRIIWHFNGNNIKDKTYDINFILYIQGLTPDLYPNRGYISNSSDNIYSCDIDKSRWAGPNAVSSVDGSVMVRCNNVNLTDNNFTFYLFDLATRASGVMAVSHATLTESISVKQANDIEKIKENTKAVNDSLNDQSDANTSGFLQDINQDYSNNPVSDLITMPITFLQTLNNNVSGSCITWDLGALLGTNLTMPCINLQQRLGSNLYNLIDMAICLFLAYNLGLMCVTIWNNMTSLKDDFDDMYSPKHVYQGKHSGGDS